MPKTPVQPTKGAEHYTVTRKFNLYSPFSCQFVSSKSWSLDMNTGEIKISSLINAAKSVTFS